MKSSTKIVSIVLAVLIFCSGVNVYAYSYQKDLQLGSSGPEVTELQTWLIDNGYLHMPNGVAKGYFGQITKMALMAYQRALGLPAYGFFGPMTREKINKNSATTTGSLTVTSPNGGESWVKGTLKNITWKSPQYIRSTFVDIKLIPYVPPCPQDKTCPAYALQPYTVVKGVSANQNSYAWKVGMVESFTDTFINDVSEIYTARDGQYTIQICETGGSICDYSDAIFTLVTQTSNRAPVISDITAPTSLGVGQKGTWSIKATDPQNGPLSYHIKWGDEPVPTFVAGMTPVAEVPTTFVQSATFTHTYANPGTYNVVITVKNNAGLVTQNGVTVKVTGTSQPKVVVVSPNGNEKWDMRSVHQIMWGVSDATPDTKVDIYAVSPTLCGINAELQTSSVASTSSVAFLSQPYCAPSTFVLDKDIPANAIYNWIVGTDIVDKPLPADNGYIMKICIAGTEVCDWGDGGFFINSVPTTTR